MLAYSEVCKRIMVTSYYPQLQQILLNEPIQSANSVLFGFFCVYVANIIFRSRFRFTFVLSP